MLLFHGIGCIVITIIFNYSYVCIVYIFIYKACIFYSNRYMLFKQ